VVKPEARVWSDDQGSFIPYPDTAIRLALDRDTRFQGSRNFGKECSEPLSIGGIQARAHDDAPGALVDRLTLPAAQHRSASGEYKHRRPSRWNGGPSPVIRHFASVCGESPRSLAASSVFSSHPSAPDGDILDAVVVEAGSVEDEDISAFPVSC